MITADLVIKSTSIFTSTASAPISGAVAAKDDKIVYVGDLVGAHAFIGADTKVLDLGDKTITPGFVEAHAHVYLTVLLNAGIMTFICVESEEKTIALMDDYVATRRPEDWIITFGWYLPLFTNKTMPTKASLDAKYPDRPVLMLSGDAHTTWMNSKAMEILGIDENTPVPQGGEHVRDANGKLTGVFKEAAGLVVCMKALYLLDQKDIFNAYDQVFKYFASYGHTTTCDISVMPLDEGNDGIREDIYKELLAQGKLCNRVEMFPAITQSLRRAKELDGINEHDMLRFGGVKQFFDGVSGTHTAFLSEPYSNAYFEGDRGRTTVSPELMEDLIFSAQEKGWSMRIHTIGDGAVHCALDSFEKAYAKFGRKPNQQHTLEHVENIQEGDIKRLHDLNVLVSAQPGHSMIDPAGIEDDLGQERIHLMWPFRRFIDDGVKLAFGTDAPIVPSNPMLTIYEAVTRQNENGEPAGGWIPEQKITLPEAIIAHTLGGAQACTMDNKIGTLEVGKYADVAVLDRDIFAAPIDELLETRCTMTILSGKIVYEA